MIHEQFEQLLGDHLTLFFVLFSCDDKAMRIEEIMVVIFYSKKIPFHTLHDHYKMCWHGDTSVNRSPHLLE